MAAPTNVAFCGPERDILLGANLGRWHITRYEANKTGLRLHYPDSGLNKASDWPTRPTGG